CLDCLDAERFLAMPIPPLSPLTLLSSPLPQIPFPPLTASPPILPIPLPTASPPLQLLSSDRRADRPEVTLPPRKRLSIVHCSRYEAGESSAAAAARPIEEDIGYGIRDAWIDPRDIAEEEALTTLEGVNTRVTELAAVQEQDTQDIYGVMEDAQGRQTEMFQRVETLVDDSRYHYETGRLVDQEARCSREAWAHSIGLSSAVHFELQGYMTHTWVQDQRIDAQDTLIATLTTQLSLIQGHLVTALGEIQALQAREQARAGAPEGAGSILEIEPMTIGEVNTRVTELAELHEHDTLDLYSLLEDAQDSRTWISQRVTVDSQRVDLLIEDRIAHQETIQIIEDEAYAAREAWAHS
nr:hypothetical protein [Tanacetum cinerariifolium]